MEQFRLACGAFNLMTLPERKRVLEEFAKLRYPLITDRFFEAVHVVIAEKDAVTDTAGRLIALEPPAPAPRPPGVWDRNGDAREPVK